MAICNSPWGKIQDTKRIAHGVTYITAENHGGLKVSANRMRVIESRFPTFVPLAGACWLERDCDAAVAMVTFPELWSEEEVSNAVVVMKKIYKGKLVADMNVSCRDAIEIAERTGC